MLNCHGTLMQMLFTRKVCSGCILCKSWGSLEYTDILVLFYCSFVDSILTFCFIAWYFSLSVNNKNKVHKIINTSNNCNGQRQNSMTTTCESRAVRKGRAIIRDVTHPLFGAYELLPSGRYYKVLPLRTNRAHRLFIPTSDALMNKLQNVNSLTELYV